MPRLAPAQRMSIGLIVWIVGLWGLCTYMLSQPWLGLSLQNHNDRVTVFAVDADGPSHGLLTKGMILTAVSGGGHTAKLDGLDVTVAPDMLKTYAQADHFYKRQSILATLLDHAQISIQTARGQTFVIQPAARTPLRALPASFWYQIGVGSFCFLLGLGVWAFRAHDRAVSYYFLTGIGVALFVGIATLYVSRELAVPGEVLKRAEKLNSLGVTLFGWGFITTVCHFPRTLWPHRPVGLWVFLFMSLLFLNNLLEWPETFSAGRNLPIALVCVVMSALGYLHSRALRNKPADRALLRWYVTCWLLGSLLFLVSYNLPLIAGQSPLIEKPWAYGLFALIYLAITLGILRYRVFDLDRWIFACWIWFFGGVLVIALDVLLISLLPVGEGTALTLAVALIGWVYFPLRQLMWGAVGINRQGINERDWRNMLSAALASTHPSELAAQWRLQLQRLFQPAAIRNIQSCSQATIADDGNMLRIPGFAEVAPIELELKQHGQRLFTRDDRDLADAAVMMFSQVATFQSAYKAGALKERERVARDLHDDVSAHLMTLIFKAESDRLPPPSGIAAMGREAMTELRTVIRGLERQSVPLHDALNAWRAEIRQRCGSGISLRWEQPDEPALARIELSARHNTNITRILRESVTNALKHAQPSTLNVTISCELNVLRLVLSNNGVDKPVPDGEGRGLHNMKRRAQELGGHFQTNLDAHHYRVTCEIPLTTPVMAPR